MRIDWKETRPAAHRAMMSLGQVAEEGTLQPDLIELVKIRASQLNACARCLAVHCACARSAGVEQQQIDLLPGWKHARCYTDQERAALAWCESLTLLAAQPGNDGYAALTEYFSAHEIVDLAMNIVVVNGWNRLGVGFATEP